MKVQGLAWIILGGMALWMLARHSERGRVSTARPAPQGANNKPSGLVQPSFPWGGSDFVRSGLQPGGSNFFQWDSMVRNIQRGIRNNNPGNIVRSGIRWRGMAEQQTDSRFVTFVSPEWGIRAMARILRSYISRGDNTIRRIVTRWAPPHENPTENYIAAVSREVGKSPDSPITLSDFPRLIAAIIRFENGVQPYTPEQIAEGIRLEQTS